MTTLVDSYSETNQNTEQSCMAYSAGPPTLYQSFTAIGGELDSCQLYLRKAVGATGNIKAKLYTHIGTFGTSSDYSGASLGISDDVSIATLSTSHGLITFNFSGANRYTLVNGTKYCLALENINAGIVYWGQDSSSPSHAGNPGYDYAGHVATPTLDHCFYVYIVSGRANRLALLGVG